jgi:hypothetical protein
MRDVVLKFLLLHGINDDPQVSFIEGLEHEGLRETLPDAAGLLGVLLDDARLERTLTDGPTAATFLLNWPYTSAETEVRAFLSFFNAMSLFLSRSSTASSSELPSELLRCFCWIINCRRKKK